MNIERFVGLAFSIGLLLLTLFVFLKPQIDYQQEQKIEVVSDTIDLQTDNSMQVVETVTPKKDVARYTLRMAKEDSKIIYRGDWAKEERAIMEDNGYKNGDDLSGKMFPTLFEKS